MIEEVRLTPGKFVNDAGPAIVRDVGVMSPQHVDLLSGGG